MRDKGAVCPCTKEKREERKQGESMSMIAYKVERSNESCSQVQSRARVGKGMRSRRCNAVHPTLTPNIARPSASVRKQAKKKSEAEARVISGRRCGRSVVCGRKMEFVFEAGGWAMMMIKDDARKTCALCTYFNEAYQC